MHAHTTSDILRTGLSLSVMPDSRTNRCFEVIQSNRFAKQIKYEKIGILNIIVNNNFCLNAFKSFSK